MKLKAQNLSEFAICLAVVTSAILGMQIYAQRGLAAKYFGSTNYLLSKFDTVIEENTKRMQFEPYYRESRIVQVSGAVDDSFSKVLEESGLKASQVDKIKELATVSNSRVKEGNKTEIRNTSVRAGSEFTAPAKDAGPELSPKKNGSPEKLLEAFKNIGDSLSSLIHH